MCASPFRVDGGPNAGVSWRLWAIPHPPGILPMTLRDQAVVHDEEKAGSQ